MAHTSKTYFDAYPTRTYASPLFTLMMDAKRYGDKAKAGFYKHEDGKALPDPALQALVSTSRAKSGRYNSVRLSLVPMDSCLRHQTFFFLVCHFFYRDGCSDMGPSGQ